MPDRQEDLRGYPEYQLGYRAKASGRPRNPHPLGGEYRDAWLLGWDEANRDEEPLGEVHGEY